MAITPIKFKLPTVEDLKPKISNFTIKDTTEKLSFTQKVKSVFEPTGYLGSETWKQMLGVGERSSTLYETAVKKPIQAVKEYMQPAPGKPIGMFSIPTLKELPAAFKEAKYTAPSAFLSSAADKFIPYRFAKLVDEKLGKYIDKLTNPLGTAIGTVLRKAGVRITPEQITKWAPKAAELDQFISKVEEIKKTQPIINMGGQLLGDMANIALISKVFAPISPAISKALPPVTQFPTTWDLALRRFITYAPQAATTFGSIKILEEGARQIEEGKFSPTKLLSEGLKGVTWGTLTAGTHVLPTAAQRIVGAVFVGSGWTTIETLIKNKQITVNDIPAIVQSGALSAAFEWINSKSVTEAYENELRNTQQKYIFENRVKLSDPDLRKEVADAIARLDAMVTMQGGERAEASQLARSARDKLMASTMYQKDVDYIVVDKNMQPIKTTTQSLADLFTPEEKILIEHVKGITGEPPPVSYKLLEPNPIVQEAMIEYPDLITRADLNLAGKPLPPKPISSLSFSLATIPMGLSIKVVGPKPEDIKNAITFIQRDGARQMEKFSPKAAEIWRTTDLSKATSIDEAKAILQKAIPESEKKKKGVMMTIESFPESAKKMLGIEAPEVPIGKKEVKLPPQLYKWTGAKTEGTVWNAMIQSVKNQLGKTMGEAVYYSLDPRSSEKFGKNIEIAKTPENLKIFDATQGLPKTDDTMSQLQAVPEYREMLKANENDFLKFMQTKGYQGIVFFADDGQSKWLALPKPAEQMKAEVPTKPLKEVKPEVKAIYEAEYKKAQGEGEGKITSDILSLGGLKTDPTLKEEMSDLPISIMRKDGISPDEMMEMLNDRGYRLESVSDMFESIRAISSMPSRYKPAESVIEQKLDTIRAIRTKMPTLKEVTPARLERLERQILREATVGRKIPPKGIIERAVGIKPQPERMVTKKESILLKMKLRAEAKGATEGMRQARAEIISQLRITRTDTSDIRKQITDYVKQALDPKDRGKANILIRDAKDQEDLVKAFIRIDTWAENAEKKAIRNDVITSVKKAIDSPAVAIDYKNKIKEVIDEFELKGHLGRTIQKLESTKKYIDERLKAGEDVEIPQRIWNSLKILTRKPYEDMTVSELKGLMDEVNTLDSLGRMKWATTEGIYKLEQDAIKKRLIEGTTPMERKEKFIPRVGEKLSTSQTFKNHVTDMINEAKKIDKVVLPMDALFDWLDGAKGTFSGPNTRLIKNKLDKDWNLYKTLKDDIQDPVVEKAIQMKMNDRNMERIGFVAARDQEGGMEKLKQLGYAEEEIGAVQLTKEEQDMLDMMRNTFEKEYPYVVDIMRKVYNQPVGKVKNYFSFMTDWSKTDESEIYKRMGPAAEELGRPTKTVDQGFTIPRKALAKQKIKLNAMSIFLRHTDNVAYLKAMGKDIKMLFEIVNSDEYKKASGDLGQLLVLEWLDLMARKGGSAGAKKIALIDLVRKNVGTGMIGLKISSAAVQWTEVIPSMGLIGPEYGMKGIWNIATSHDWREFVMKFPEIKDRAGGETAIRELIDGSAFRKLQAKAFVPLQLVDTWAASSVAAGAYEKKMAELGKEIDLSEEPNKEAMEYAQQIVRRNQGVAGYKDVPLAISRGAISGSTSVDRAFLQFQNFVLFRWSRIRYEALKAGIDAKDPIKTAGILFWTLVGMIAAVGTKMGVDALSDFVTGKDRKDVEATKKFLYEVVGSVPFLGNLYGSYLYDNELIPIFSAPSEALQDLKKALTSKNPNTRVRGLSGFITTLMTLMGVPGMLQTEQILKKAIPTEAPKQLLPPTKGRPSIPAPSKPSSFKPKSSLENLLANIFKKELA